MAQRGRSSEAPTRVCSCIPSSRVSAPMQRLVLPAIIAAFTFTTATAGPLNLNPPSAGSPHPPGNVETPPIRLAQGPIFGGGFLELLFRGPRGNDAAPR